MKSPTKLPEDTPQNETHTIENNTPCHSTTKLPESTNGKATTCCPGDADFKEVDKVNNQQYDGF